MTGRLSTKRVPDCRKARFGRSNIYIYVGGVLQTPVRRREAGEKGAHAVARLVPGCPICADEGYASEREGVTARGARVNGSQRCDCHNQRYQEDTTARGDCSDQCHASGV